MNVLSRVQRYYQRGTMQARGYGQIGAVDSGAFSRFISPVQMRAIPTLTVLTVALSGSPAGYDRFFESVTVDGWSYIYRHGGGSGSGNLYYLITFEAAADL